MSKILASIADAETAAHTVGASVLKDQRSILSRATAARAEHAEIVDGLQRTRDLVAFWAYKLPEPLPEQYGVKRDLADLDSLLSRVGGGA